MADIERKKNVRVQSSWNKIFLRSNVALVEKHLIDTQCVRNFIENESTTITKVCVRIITRLVALIAFVNQRHPQALSLWNFIDVFGVVFNILQLYIIILARKIWIE